MKVLKQFYLFGGLALIGFGIWLIGDRFYGLFPIGFGIYTFYKVIKGDWFNLD
jgi:hypothetical protein